MLVVTVLNLAGTLATALRLYDYRGIVDNNSSRVGRDTPFPLASFFGVRSDGRALENANEAATYFGVGSDMLISAGRGEAEVK